MSELVVGSIAGLASNSYVVDVSAGSTLDLTNATSLPSSALPTGSVLQVVSTTKTNTFSASVGGGGTVDVTGLTATITPTSTSSKILVMVSVHGSNSDGPKGTMSFFIQRNTTPILVGDAASNRTRTTASAHVGGAFAENIMSTTMQGLDSPNTTSAITYKVTAHNITGGTSTVYVNRMGNDGDANYVARTASNITLMEVAG